MNSRLTIVALLCAAALVLAGPAYADVPRCGSGSTDEWCRPAGELQYVPLEPLRPCNTQNCANEYPDLGSYLNTAYGALLTLGALFAVVTFTIGGVAYMTSDAIGRKSAAVERMKAAVWGLLLLLASWLFLDTINPGLLKFDLLNRDLPRLGQPSGTAVPTNPNASTTTWVCIVNNAQVSQFTYKFGETTAVAQNTFVQTCEAAGGIVKAS